MVKRDKAYFERKLEELKLQDAVRVAKESLRKLRGKK